MASQRQFEELNLQNTQVAIQPEFMVKYGMPAEQILLASHALKSDLIVWACTALLILRRRPTCRGTLLTMWCAMHTAPS